VIRAMIGAQKALGIGTVLLIPASLYMVFVYAPNEATMGVVQRIFLLPRRDGLERLSFHRARRADELDLPHPAGGYVEPGRKKRRGAGGPFHHPHADRRTPFGRGPVWNVWWTWDPRLVTTLILWFFYVAYLLIQAGAGESQRQKRFAAAFWHHRSHRHPLGALLGGLVAEHPSQRGPSGVILACRRRC